MTLRDDVVAHELLWPCLPENSVLLRPSNHLSPNIRRTQISAQPDTLSFTLKMVKVLENRIVDLDILPGTKEEQEAAAKAKYVILLHPNATDT